MDKTLGEVLQNLVDKNIRIFPILKEEFKTLAYAFFDTATLSGQDMNGNPMTKTTIQPKNLKSIESSLTVDGESIKWYDYAITRFKTTIVADATLTPVAGVITITTVDTPDVALWDKIFLTKSAAAQSEVDGIVSAFDVGAKTIGITVETVDGITYNGTDNVDVKITQNVARGSWLRNDNDEITRSSSNAGYDEFQTYVQHFSERMTITKKELNKIYELEGEAKRLASQRLATHIHTIISGVAEQLYKGRNAASGATATEKLQMMWFEEVCRRAGTIVDLTASVNMEKDLRTQIGLSIRGASKLGGSQISLLCNSSFLDNLSEIDQDKIRYDGKVNVLEVVFPRYITPYGEVEILRDPILDELYGYSVCFTAPLGFVKLWIRENQEFNPTAGISRADQSIRFYEVVHNLREKDIYDLEFECGLLPGWMMTGAYRMIKNFSVA